ncbi:MAG: PAS domain S-box protein [Candidatus Aminicenantes bacterium]|nr:PAS domain S-box protein [Candidatus Aminicenantes bacterium]
MLNIKYFLPSLIFCLFISTAALYPQAYNVRTYTEIDGLASSEVYDVTQDLSGYMWFAGRRGITRFDGSSWQTFSDSGELPAAVYSQIRCDTRGTIWVLSTHSELIIAYLREGSEEWELLPAPLPTEQRNIVSSFAVTLIKNQPVVAVGTMGMGLFLWVGNSWINLSTKQGLISPNINHLAARGNTLYIATERGLSVIQEGRIDNSINNLLTLPSPQVLRIAVDRNITYLLGKEWLGRLEGKVFKMAAYPITEPRFNADFFVQPDYRGGVFYGSRYEFFYVDVESGVIQSFGKEQGLIAGGATAAYLDREKNLWFTSLRGVNKISSMRFANYRKVHGLLSDETTAIWESTPGNFVLGHNGGLTFFDPGKNRFRRLTLREQDSRYTVFRRVLDIRGDRLGNTWAAASYMGLLKINGNKIIRRYSVKEGLAGQVNSVFIDRRGKVWAGTNKGIFQLQGSTFKKAAPGQNDEVYIRRLFPGPGDSIYAATSTKGLYLFKAAAKNAPRYSEDSSRLSSRLLWKNYRHEKEPGVNSTYAVLVDSSGMVWVGTGAGLYQLKNEKLVKFTAQGYHLDRPVYFILEDKNKRPWFGTDNGVIRWDGKEWKEYAMQQGLVGRETNRAAGFVDHRGHVWIGTDLGLSCYREKFEKKEVPPPIVELLFLGVPGERLSLKEDKSLKYGMNNFMFSFRITSFTDEDSIYYRSWLEGFDVDWSPVSLLESAQVRYTNLPPGRYRFHLKASNSEGSWSQAVSSAAIIILEPFWWQWWFYVFFLLILGAVTFVLYTALTRWRYTKMLEKQVWAKTGELQKTNEKLEERVRERTQEFTQAYIELQIEIKERKKVEEALRASEAKYRGLFENMLEGVYQTEPDGTILAANPALVRMLGFDSVEEFFSAGSARQFYVNPEERDILSRRLEENGELRNAEYSLRRKNGKEIRVVEDGRVVRDEQGRVLHYEGLIIDITQRKQAEEKVKASLKEKEVLLREIHHRVKNNLQVIVGLLNLQAKYIDDKRAVDIFKNSRQRVMAMALVHEKLYQSEDLSRINFREYIQSLTRHLFDTYSYMIDPQQVHLKTEIADIVLDIETAIPLGLLINELVTNALKYSFPGGRAGELRVVLDVSKGVGKKYEYHLIVVDNGVGFPAERDFRDSGTLGMLLVNSLVQQLRGTIDLDRSGGTKFIIEFKKK